MKMESKNKSKMFQAGYNCSVNFTYIPEFNTPQEKADFEAGLKEGYYHQEKGDRIPVIG